MPSHARDVDDVAPTDRPDHDRPDHDHPDHDHPDHDHPDHDHPDHHAALRALGRDAGPWTALLLDAAPHLDPDGDHGRVVRTDRGTATALTPTGPRRAATGRHGVVTGDWVALDGDRVAAVASRRTALARPAPTGGDAGGADQVLAANADLVGLVASADVDLRSRRLERGLVMAYESGAVPLVLLTKADASDHLDRVRRDAVRAAPGVDVVAVSAVDGRGLDDLAAALAPDRTIALLGASGTGKSTLANALVGREVLATQAIRRVDGKGRHTTTRRELVPLPGGGAVLDTPGLRTVSLGEVGDGIDRAFPDIEQLAAGCRFADCSHEVEPGCEVLAAVEDGRLHADRHEGWRRVRAAAASAALRADVAAQRRQARRWGAIAREAQRIRGR